ncbi:MAG: family 43 glycosylhydrolase, partial [Alistipes sp.]|nr:family 43 glycosylhydrolase [Alistipes sp.]
KHGDDVFLLYSTRGSWTANYKMGLLKLIDRSNPLDSRSWEKHGPVFADDDPHDEVFGVGHASYTTSPDGRENWILYHSKKALTGGWQREVYLQPFTFDPQTGLPVFGKPVGKGELKRPSGEYEAELSGMKSE